MPSPVPNRPRSSYSNADLYLVIEQALTDPTRTPDHRDQLVRSLVAECMQSPAAFKRLCTLKAPASLPTDELKMLFARAWEACRTDGARRQFRLWIEQSDFNWYDLLSEEFLDGLIHPESQIPLLTRSQRRAWQVLEEMSDLHFSGVLRKAAVSARTSVLIAGPSGVGKSHLLAAFAKTKGLEYMRITYGSWIPSGAKREPNTEETIRQFLHSDSKLLIHIDELDKIVSANSGDWATALLNELYALLDRTWYSSSGPISKTGNERAARNLQDNCLLVGTGTWQNLWSIAGGERSAIGFGVGNATPMAGRIRAARTIPTELLNRFHDELILLEPLTRSDFVAIIKATGLEEMAQAAGHNIDLDEAVQSGLGMRWVEGLVTRLHIKIRAQFKAEAIGPTPPQSPPPNHCAPELDERR